MVGFIQNTGSSLFGMSTPGSMSSDTTRQVVRMFLQSSVPGRISGLRYFRDLSDAGLHWILAVNAAGEGPQMAVFDALPATGTGPDKWYGRYLKKWIRVAAGDLIRLTAFFANGRMYEQRGVLSGHRFESSPLIVLADGEGGSNNCAYSYNLTMNPSASTGATLFGIDLFFVAD